MTTPPPSPSLERWAALTAASPQAVRLLLVLQGVLTAGLALGLLLAAQGFALELPYGPLWTLTGGYGLGTAAAALWRGFGGGGGENAGGGRGEGERGGLEAPRSGPRRRAARSAGSPAGGAVSSV